MTDITLFDLHTDKATLTQVMSTVRAWAHAFPEFEILMDGDRYGIFARRRTA